MKKLTIYILIASFSFLIFIAIPKVVFAALTPEAAGEEEEKEKLRKKKACSAKGCWESQG